jgi:predicted dehydrogenase
VDPLARHSPWWPELSRRATAVHGDIDSFYAAGHRADLVVIASPIHCHVPQALVALAHGSHVLCDKPLGATAQDAECLRLARDQSHRIVLVGYQWTYSSAVQALKRDLVAGRFGKAIHARALCSWPRPLAYYQRNSWAGRKRDEASGAWVLDSPANNAMAHFLHNLLFLLGPAQESSASLGAVQAELYRAYPVENGDTTLCRARTAAGADVLFYASHATRSDAGPMFRIELERATVRFGETRASIVATTIDGDTIDYGAPDDTPQFHKLAVALERVRVPGPIPCGIETATPQTICVNGMQDSVPDALAFPARLLREEQEPRRTWVEGLGETLLDCYEHARLPGEIGIEWARMGRSVNLAGYRRYPGGAREARHP